jgi:hypothetical protein
VPDADTGVAGLPMPCRDAIAASSQQADPDAAAWTMRRAFDSILDGSAALRASITTQLASGATEFPIVSYADRAGADAGPQWYSMDDVIMGGVSNSSAAYNAAEQALVFAGHVTTDSGGGFASVRSRPWAGWQALGAAKGVRMSVKGDGRVYKLSLKVRPGPGPGLMLDGAFAQCVLCCCCDGAVCDSAASPLCPHPCLCTLSVCTWLYTVLFPNPDPSLFHRAV